MSKRGKFIVFEGLDGSGKTTQLFKLKRKLVDYQILCKDEREPSDGIIGLMTRGAVKKKITMQPESLALLFAADRYEHVVNDIIPELEQGVHVLCDRFVFSSLAYQSIVLPMEKILEYNSIVIETLMPDLTIFIDTPPDICAKRIKEARIHLELFEDIAKTSAIKDNFYKSFEILEDRTKVKKIDGNKNESVVFDKVWDAVRPVFNLFEE
jgi:dTMP kinase